VLGRRPIGIRGKVWGIKTSPDLFHPYLESRHSQSSKDIRRAYGLLDMVTQKIAPVLDRNGVFSSFRVIYRAYAEELWRLKESFSGKALDSSANAISAKYEMYGCDTDILKEVAYVMGLEVDFVGLAGFRDILEEELDERRVHRIPSFDEPIEGTLTVINLNEEYELLLSEIGLPHYVEGYLSLENLQAGDSVLLSFYTRIRSTSSYIVYDTDAYSDAQVKPALYFLSKPSKHGIKITLKQTSGTQRNFEYIFFRRRAVW